MFPVGTAGAALFALRVLVAGTLVVDGTAHWALVTSSWVLIGYVLPALFLLLGLLTPYFAAISALIELHVLITAGRTDQFHLITSILSGGILVILGPGAYSVDASIFGRKLISFPPRR
jgi:uncharacterized membrane protein YphA (DoxX/SURF4 family)